MPPISPRLLEPLTARPAVPGDVAFMLATERLEGYDRLVGRWSEAHHSAALRDPDTAYLVAEAGGAPVGFAILVGLLDPNGNVGLQRIAMAMPGHGLGRPFLGAIVDDVFARPAAHRLWLDVLMTNARARHVYRRVGFVQEGIAREAWRQPDGHRCAVEVMSILRHEWAARPRR